jgi:hypothetical protein
MELDYLLSNGRWMACDERSEEFLNRCLIFFAESTKEEILQKLNEGNELRYGSNWNNMVRSSVVFKERKRKLDEIIAIRNTMKRYETVEEFDARDDER